MTEKWMLILFFGGLVGVVWSLSMLSTPHKGFTRVLERAAAGAALCFLCYALLSPFGIHIPRNPVSALLAGYLGLPGVAFSAFVSLWP